MELDRCRICVGECLAESRVTRVAHALYTARPFDHLTESHDHLEWCRSMAIIAVKALARRGVAQTVLAHDIPKE